VLLNEDHILASKISEMHFLVKFMGNLKVLPTNELESNLQVLLLVIIGSEIFFMIKLSMLKCLLQMSMEEEITHL
jgi:hypothetical protein